MKLLYISIISFIFIATSAIAIQAMAIEVPPVKKEILVLDKRYENTKLPEIPILKDGAEFPLLSAQSVYAVDATTNVPLFEKDPDSPFLPASTTKMTTALVALEHYPLDEIVKVDGVKSTGQRMYLIEGEEISIENLLYGLLVYSANDAAEVLAANYPGGRAAFIDEMNKKAVDLHLKNTYFANPTGLDNNDQVTTARDLAYIAVAGMKNPVFRELVGTKSKIVKSVDGKLVHKLTNINTLLGEVDGVLGVKTGWTENARENLVTYIRRDGKDVIITLLGSQDRFGETKELISWIFDNYEWQEVNP